MLRRGFFGRRFAAPHDAALARLRDFMIGQRHFLYVRVEDDYREIEFLPDGRIGEGAGRMEQSWGIEWRRGKALLAIRGQQGLTCRLILEDTGVLRGQCGKKLVSLLPRSNPLAFRPKLSFYTTCMGRLHHLRITLRANIEAALRYKNVEFVLLDYNSNDGLEAWARHELSSHIASGVVQYYKTTRPTVYDSSHAKNTAARLTTGDIICNLDADNWLGLGFAEHLVDLFDSRRTIVRAEAPWGGVYGRISFFRDDFIALGGHDESFIGYGFDDTDLINRARAAGFVDKQFAAKYALCLSHSNAERLENMQVDKLVSHRQNKLQSARNIAAGALVANVGKAWGEEPIVKNFGQRAAA